jgi:hypothetical protein
MTPMAAETREQAEDRVVDGVVDETLAAFGHWLTPAEREQARALLGDVLATHPATGELIDQLLPAKEVERSDKISKDGDDAGEDDGAMGGTG